jgi:hypothetical protein
LPVRIEDYEDSISGRAEAVKAALSVLARPEDVGRPFGPGCGLELARSWILQLMPRGPELRSVGHDVAETLMAGMWSKQIIFDDIDHVLGINDASRRRFGLSRSQARANIYAIQEPKDILIYFFEENPSKDDAKSLSRWRHDILLAAEMLAYHQLAVLRLQVVGKI